MDLIDVFIAITLISGASAFVALLALFALGTVVTKRHPGKYDPARNAKRYTRPAGVLVLLIVIAVILTIVGFIGIGVVLIST